MATNRQTFIPGSFYHVYNRGVAKCQIFACSRDYLRFTGTMGDLLTKYSLKLIAFNLMPNHFHFGIWQAPMGKPISRFMQSLGTSYAQYFNRRMNRVGHLFQDRFKSKTVEDDRYLLDLSSYIHNNAVEHYQKTHSRITNLKAAILFSRDYQWSSYRYYLEGNAPKWLDTSIVLSYFAGNRARERYREFVEGQSFKKLRQQYRL